MHCFNKRNMYMFLCILSFFLLPASSEARYLLVPAQAPAIITTPDYVDPFQAPSPSALSGQLFRSKEGYLFSFDATGRRVYHMYPSYVLAPRGGSVSVHYIAAPLVSVHPGAALFHGPAAVLGGQPPAYYILVP